MILELPSVASGVGGKNVAGSMVFGIGTQSNNALNSSAVVMALDADNSHNAWLGFSTEFNNVAYPDPNSYTGLRGNIIDSGAIDIFFLNQATTGINTCGSGLSAHYCPASTQNLTAGNQASGSTIRSEVPFFVSDPSTLPPAPPLSAIWPRLTRQVYRISFGDCHSFMAGMSTPQFGEQLRRAAFPPVHSGPTAGVASGRLLKTPHRVECSEVSALWLAPRSPAVGSWLTWGSSIDWVQVPHLLTAADVGHHPGHDTNVNICKAILSAVSLSSFSAAPVLKPGGEDCEDPVPRSKTSGEFRAGSVQL